MYIKGYWRKITFLIVLLILGVLSSIVIRGTTMTKKQLQVRAVDDYRPNAGQLAIGLSRAITFGNDFSLLHTFLQRQFPRVHQKLERTKFGDSLIFHWAGSDSKLKPILFVGHQDVVPEGDPAFWEFPAFSGEIADGYIWGRGSMDNKVSVVGLLDAVEILLQQNFEPKRSIYFAFGHDEEVGGFTGAKKIAQWFSKKNIQFEYIFDEGMTITEGIIKGINQPIATVGIAEKGYLELSLTARGEAGHSSVPTEKNPLSILTRAIYKLESQPFPASLTGAIGIMTEYLGPEMSLTSRLALANLWLFKGVVKQQFSRIPVTNAMIRTTVSPTIFKGGQTPNVVPLIAKATLNLRIIPGETIDGVISRVEKIINDDRVEIEPTGPRNNPSKVSSVENWAFKNIHKSIKQVYPDVLVVPSLLMGGTDSKHYAELTDSIYRFVPMRLREEDLQRIHGYNERISVDGFADIVMFYRQLITNSTY